MHRDDFLIKSINSYKVLIDNQAYIIREDSKGNRIKFALGDLDNIPSKLSEFENDVPYATVSQLSSIPKFEIKVVDSLPASEISLTTVYLVPSLNPKEKNLYEEWIYVNNKWEILGKQDIDLTQYVKGYKQNLTLWKGTKQEYDAITSKDENTIYFITE